MCPYCTLQAMKKKAARLGNRVALLPTTWGSHGYDVWIDDGVLKPETLQLLPPISPLYQDAHLGWVGAIPTRCTCHHAEAKEAA